MDPICYSFDILSIKPPMKAISVSPSLTFSPKKTNLKRSLSSQKSSFITVDILKIFHQLAMADNLNFDLVIRFHRTPDARFYMCRSCRNHVCSDLCVDPSLDSIICQNPLNVRAENVESVWIPSSRALVVDVFCKECNSVLGQKFFSVITRFGGIRVVQGGTFMLNLDKLLFWDGHQVVYADTFQPVEDN